MTTLTQARAALIKLSGQFPAPSTYADQLAVVSDYLDREVPLSIENKSLIQRLTVLEAALDAYERGLHTDAAKTAIRSISRAAEAGLAPNRRHVDCVAWIGPAATPCKCPACAVSSHV